MMRVFRVFCWYFVSGVSVLFWLTILVSWLYVDHLGPVYTYPAPELVAVISDGSVQARDIRFPNYIPRDFPFLGDRENRSVEPLFREGVVIELPSDTVERLTMLVFYQRSEDRPPLYLVFNLDKPLTPGDTAKERLKLEITKVVSAEAQNFEQRVKFVPLAFKDKATTTSLGRIKRVWEEYEARLVPSP